ncbi:MAG: DNA-binding protein WhiA [Clostridiales bacterium]|nr:DNA-binding protein WhiA [Clostridiales bacterium]
MNFTTALKKEILQQKPENSCCEYALLSGFLRSSVSVIKNSAGYGFELRVESEEIANFFSELLFKLYGTEPDLFAFKEDKLNACERFILRYHGERAFFLMKELGILSFDNNPELLSTISPYLTENECCRRAYLKGVFLGAGTATLPEKSSSDSTQKTATGYHLQFVFSTHAYATSFCAFLAEFDLLPKLIERKSGFVVYFKSSQQISDILALIGTSNGVLTLQDRLVEKSFQNDLNRRVNCEMGNMTKQVNAFVAHKMAIEGIDQVLGLENLPQPLQAVCIARLENPDVSMETLAELLGISKSCLNHRLRKITSIYRTITQ